MFFSERERTIYGAPHGGRYDPLRVDRLLVIHTRNALNELIALRNNADSKTGDVSKQGRAEAAVCAADAELQLSDAARRAFDLKPFTEEGGVTDAIVLETLYHFMEWMEGKDSKAGTPQSTPVTAFESRQGDTTSSLH